MHEIIDESIVRWLFCCLIFIDISCHKLFLFLEMLIDKDWQPKDYNWILCSSRKINWILSKYIFEVWIYLKAVRREYIIIYIHIEGGIMCVYGGTRHLCARVVHSTEEGTIHIFFMHCSVARLHECLIMNVCVCGHMSCRSTTRVPGTPHNLQVTKNLPSHQSCGCTYTCVKKSTGITLNTVCRLKQLISIFTPNDLRVEIL